MTVETSPTATLVGERESASASASSESPQNQPSSSSNPPSTPHSTFPDSTSKIYAGSGTIEDPFVVKFNEGDAEDPLNFTEFQKWSYVANVAMGTLAVAFGSSIYAGGFAAMESYFNVSPELLTAGLSLYVLGFAFGPLIFAPCSEIYGRKIVFICTYSIFALMQIGCALSRNIESLLVFRFLAGFFGSSPLVNSGGVIGDMFSASERSLATTLYALAPFLGPVLGPIVGGYLGQSVSFRWLFWLMTMFGGAMFFVGLLVPETYAPVLLRRRAKKLSIETGQIYISQFDLGVSSSITLGEKLKTGLTRPFLLLREPIVFLLSLYTAIVYGTLYLMFGAFPIVFQINRRFSAGSGGLAFIGIAVGFFLGGLINVFENRRYAALLRRNGGHLPPEARLRMACVGGVCIAVGLFAFAWTALPVSIHWSAPVILSVPFGTGMLLVFLSITTYLIDAYLYYAASALAANAVFRSLFGAAFPLFTDSMFTKLGVNWALTLVAFLALVCVPLPFLFMRYGAYIRSKSTFAPGHATPTISKTPTRSQKELVEELREADLREADDEEAERRYEKNHV